MPRHSRWPHCWDYSDDTWALGQILLLETDSQKCGRANHGMSLITSLLLAETNSDVISQNAVIKPRPRRCGRNFLSTRKLGATNMAALHVNLHGQEEIMELTFYVSQLSPANLKHCFLSLGRKLSQVSGLNRFCINRHPAFLTKHTVSDLKNYLNAQLKDKKGMGRVLPQKNTGWTRQYTVMCLFYLGPKITRGPMLRTSTSLEEPKINRRPYWSTYPIWPPVTSKCHINFKAHIPWQERIIWL